MSLSTITDCSEAQIIPLSNVFECMIELTASTISALVSMMAGVFPAPTPSAGLPEEYAALTIPGPPVARMISADFMIRLVISSEGTSIQPIMPSGAPAFTAASNTIFAASIVDFLALGCGLMIMPFLVFKHIRVLNIDVDVGLVVGITAATRPMDSAIFCIPAALSSSITPHVLASLYALYMYSEAKLFFITLSSTQPMPVSSTAILARGSLAAHAADAAALKISSTFSWGYSANFS